MSKLIKMKNNFTTPEQSKKLLDLGLPADSADCVWYNPYYDGDRPELAEVYVWKGKYPQRIDKYTIPCWSVGRIEEIIKISTLKGIVPNLTYPTYSEAYIGEKETYVDVLIGVIEHYKELGIMKFDRLYLDENEK